MKIEWENAIKFGVCMIPFAAAGGWFTGSYAYASVSGEMKQLIMEQSGSVGMVMFDCGFAKRYIHCCMCHDGLLDRGKYRNDTIFVHRTRPLITYTCLGIWQWNFLCARLLDIWKMAAGGGKKL